MLADLNPQNTHSGFRPGGQEFTWEWVFSSQGTLGNVWRHFWLSQVGRSLLVSGPRPGMPLDMPKCTGPPSTAERHQAYHVYRVKVEKLHCRIVVLTPGRLPESPDKLTRKRQAQPHSRRWGPIFCQLSRWFPPQFENHCWGVLIWLRSWTGIIIHNLWGSWSTSLAQERTQSYDKCLIISSLDQYFPICRLWSYEVCEQACVQALLIESKKYSLIHINRRAFSRSHRWSD